MDFAEFISNYLKEKDLSYRQMGELCNLSHVEIGRLANGKKPSMKSIDKIAKSLDVSKNKLLKLAGYLDKEIKNDLKEKLPEETLELLDEENLEFIADLAQDDQRQILLKESKKLSQKDLARVIQIIRTFAEE